MDAIEFGKNLGALVRETVAKAVGEVATRLAALEQRLAELPVPKNGTSVTLDDVRPLIADEVKEAVAALPKAVDGKSVTVDEVLPTLREELQQAISAIPAAKDGNSVTVDDVRPLIDQAIASAVKEIPVPKDGDAGTSVEIDEVLPALESQVSAFLKAIPTPTDGKSVTVPEVLDALMPSLNSMHNAWALDFERRAAETLQRACERIPKPADGKDGLGFDDLAIEFDGLRTLTFKFARGEIERTFATTLPIVLDCGVFKDGESYERGDGVTFGGSFWIAQTDAPDGKPGAGDEKNWRLAVKKGRDGKDGVVRTVAQPATVKVPK